MKYSLEQISIINSREARVMVHSVAGSGKTTVIKALIKKAIGEGTPISKIMACTFTRKMAKELQVNNRRLEWIDTIHGICFKIVNKHKESMGYKRVILVDDIEDKEIIKNIIARNNYKLTQKLAAQVINEYCGSGIIARDKKAEEIFLMTYLRELRSKDLITYGLIELYAYQVIKVNPDIGFDLVIVDEYQDTSPLEANIVSMLAKSRIILVGDMMQSIYGFRGSDMTNIQNIDVDKTYSMVHSYRLPGQIADLANSIIAANDFGYMMKIEPNGLQGTVDLVHDLSSEAVRDSITGLLKSYDPEQIYVLTRTNRQVHHLVEALSDLPIDKDMAAIKDMRYLSYLDIACSAYYNNYPNQVLIRLLRLFDYRDHQIVTMEAAGGRIYDRVANDIPIREFNSVMARDISMKSKAAILLPMFEKQRGEYERFMQRVLPYLDAVDSDIEFLEWYQDMSAADFMPRDKIAILTAHSAKGLENEAVVIPYVTDGVFPNARSDPREELRLFYVACTRAREALVIHYDKSEYIKEL